MSDDTLVPRAPAHPAVTLSAFAESLIKGRRVAVLGDATAALAEKLVERGARLVHVYDPDAGRVAIAAAGRAGSDRALQPSVALFADDLGVRDGAFDVVIVPDLPLFEDPEEVVRRVRRLASSSGVAIFASPNPDATRFLLPPAHALHRALGYYELFDAVSLQFPEVRMIGQAPFVGYALVDFSEPDPEVSVDTSLLDEPEVAEWYVVVAGERRVEIEPFALIEIALSEVGRLALPEPITLPPMRPTGPSEAEVMLAAAQTRMSVLSTENENLREKLTEVVRSERSFEHASLRAVELERDTETLKVRLGETEALREAEQRRGDALAADVARLTTELAQARETAELAARDAHAARALERPLADAKRRVAELELHIAGMDPPTLRSKEMQQQRIAALETQKATLETQKIALEERERSLSAGVRKLEQELGSAKVERDRLSQELLAAKLERDQAANKHGQLAQQVTALDAKLASKSSGPSPAEVSRMRDLAGQSAALEEEVRRLEQMLRERGHEITRLGRELRETERVGRELLLDLEAARKGARAGASGVGGASPAGGSSPNATAGTPKAEASDGGERLARVEADLLSAGWTIARLERELSDAKPADGKPRDPARDLSLALAAAQREIASLRLRGFDHAGATTGVAQAEILEQAVLVSQVEAERVQPDRRS